MTDRSNATAIGAITASGREAAGETGSAQRGGLLRRVRSASGETGPAPQGGLLRRVRSASRAAGPGPLAAAFWGSVGVAAFSFSLPATRVAVEDLDPTVVGLGRALVAAALGAVLLAWRRETLPDRADWPRLAIVAIGVVIGFPIFTSLALEDAPSAHASVIVGLLPAATAVMAVARAGERPSPAFWAAAGAGLVAVLIFAAAQGAGGVTTSDVYLLIGVPLCGLGYAEGGALARRYGGWQVICWALVLAAPALIPVVAIAGAGSGLHADAESWLCFAYVAVISMFLAFFAWYRGLALGGVARIGQIQLAQPVLTLVWAAALLGEEVTAATLAAALAVLACVGATQRARAPTVRA